MGIFGNLSHKSFASLNILQVYVILNVCYTATNHFPDQCSLLVNEIPQNTYQIFIHQICFKTIHLESYIFSTGDNEIMFDIRYKIPNGSQWHLVPWRPHKDNFLINMSFTCNTLFWIPVDEAMGSLCGKVSNRWLILCRRFQVFSTINFYLNGLKHTLSNQIRYRLKETWNIFWNMMKEKCDTWLHFGDCRVYIYAKVSWWTC